MTTPAELAREVAAHGVTDARLLAAVRAVPRAAFVPDEHAGRACSDEPVPIGHGQVSTQPSLSCRMIEGLALSGGEHVLEVGTGTGYQAALLARQAADVVSVEYRADLAATARRVLTGLGVDTVRVLTGDGTLGAPEFAPFDAVLVSAAYPRVPSPLVDQLRVGGRLVQPIGVGGHETVVAFARTPEGLVCREELLPARFVPLHGRHGFPEPE